MSVGLYAHTTRATGTVLTASIYNSDHQNHITNQNPSMTGAYSDSVGQMQTNTDPGGIGSESLAPHIAGELERLRFCIKRITGEAQWYVAPDVDLATLFLGPPVPVTLAGAQSLQHLRRTENDAVEREIFDFQSGSGLGNKYSWRIIGSGANAVATVRDYIGAVPLTERAATYLKSFVNLLVGTNGEITLAEDGFVDFAEIAAPTNPAANILRQFAKDVSGTTVPAWLDSAGVDRTIPATAYSEYLANADITASIPRDDTIPQDTEGTQILSAAITLKRASSKLRIRFQGWGTCLSAQNDDTTHWIAALFLSTNASAVDAAMSGPGAANVNGANYLATTFLAMETEVTPGGVGPFTYNIRVGVDPTIAGATLRMNGTSLARLFGGVSRSTLILEEVFV